MGSVVYISVGSAPTEVIVTDGYAWVVNSGTPASLMSVSGILTEAFSTRGKPQAAVYHPAWPVEDGEKAGIFVTNSWNGSLTFVALDNSFTETYNLFDIPYGVIVGPDLYVWVACNNCNTMLVARPGDAYIPNRWTVGHNPYKLLVDDSQPIGTYLWSTNTGSDQIGRLMIPRAFNTFQFPFTSYHIDPNVYTFGNALRTSVIVQNVEGHLVNPNQEDGYGYSFDTAASTLVTFEEFATTLPDAIVHDFFTSTDNLPTDVLTFSYSTDGGASYSNWQRFQNFAPFSPTVSAKNTLLKDLRVKFEIQRKDGTVIQEIPQESFPIKGEGSRLIVDNSGFVWVASYTGSHIYKLGIDFLGNIEQVDKQPANYDPRFLLKELDDGVVWFVAKDAFGNQSDSFSSTTHNPFVFLTSFDSIGWADYAPIKVVGVAGDPRKPRDMWFLMDRGWFSRYRYDPNWLITSLFGGADNYDATPLFPPFTANDLVFTSDGFAWVPSEFFSQLYQVYIDPNSGAQSINATINLTVERPLPGGGTSTVTPHPRRIFVDLDQRLWMTDWVNKCVYRYSDDTGLDVLFLDYAPNAIAFGAEGVWVGCDEGKVVAFKSSDLSLLGEIAIDGTGPLGSRCFDITFNPLDGQVWLILTDYDPATTPQSNHSEFTLLDGDIVDDSMLPNRAVVRLNPSFVFADKEISGAIEVKIEYYTVDVPPDDTHVPALMTTKTGYFFKRSYHRDYVITGEFGRKPVLKDVAFLEDIPLDPPQGFLYQNFNTVSRTIKFYPKPSSVEPLDVIKDFAQVGNQVPPLSNYTLPIADALVGLADETLVGETAVVGSSVFEPVSEITTGEPLGDTPVTKWKYFDLKGHRLTIDYEVFLNRVHTVEMLFGGAPHYKENDDGDYDVDGDPIGVPGPLHRIVEAADGSVLIWSTPLERIYRVGPDLAVIEVIESTDDMGYVPTPIPSGLPINASKAYIDYTGALWAIDESGKKIYDGTTGVIKEISYHPTGIARDEDNGVWVCGYDLYSNGETLVRYGAYQVGTLETLIVSGIGGWQMEAMEVLPQRAFHMIPKDCIYAQQQVWIIACDSRLDLQVHHTGHPKELGRYQAHVFNPEAVNYGLHIDDIAARETWFIVEEKVFPGSHQEPRGITFVEGNSGDFLVTFTQGYFDSAIGRFNSDGEQIDVQVTSPQVFYDITVDRNGDFWAIDRYEGSVVWMDNQYTIKEVIPVGDKPHSLVIDADDNIYVALYGEDKIAKLIGYIT